MIVAIDKCRPECPENDFFHADYPEALDKFELRKWFVGMAVLMGWEIVATRVTDPAKQPQIEEGSLIFTEEFRHRFWEAPTVELHLVGRELVSGGLVIVCGERRMFLETVSPHEAAVVYILHRTKVDADFRWHMTLTQSLRLCMIAEAKRRGVTVESVEAEIYQAEPKQVAEIVTLREKIEALEEENGKLHEENGELAGDREEYLREDCIEFDAHSENVHEVLRSWWIDGSVPAERIREIAEAAGIPLEFAL